MDTKICPKCRKEKTINEFHKDFYSKDGLKCYCAECCRNMIKEWRKTYPEKDRALRMKRYKENPEKFKARSKKYREENSEKVKVMSKKYHEENSEKEREFNKKWRKENPKYDVNWFKKKRKSNPIFRLNINLSSAISRSLKGEKNGNNWEGLVGYNLKDLKDHLEKKFKKGMNWSNYGKGEGKWHIDHILPVSRWNIKSVECEDFKRCWALNNLQPLWEKINLSKGNRIPESKSQLELFI